MRVGNRLVAAGVASAMLVGLPGSASASMLSSSDAEKLRKLDIMLMVSSLRCRMGPDNFQPDYHKFSARHLPHLNAASNRMKADLTQRHGARGAKRALDKVSVMMANEYGNGHPWLGCKELKQTTRDLMEADSHQHLLTAADELLSTQRPARLAMVAGQ